MRLKEPLQGIKMSQGHMIIHLAFFLIIQFFTDTVLTPAVFKNSDDDGMAATLS